LFAEIDRAAPHCANLGLDAGVEHLSSRAAKARSTEDPKFLSVPRPSGEFKRCSTSMN
jgi:hypothetical protein